MNVCRVCMGSIQEDGIKISIFSNVSGEQISKMITICSGIKVQRKDQLTKHVCSTCFNRLEQFVALRNDCLNTQLALEKLVHSQTVQEAPNTEMTCKLEIEYLYDEFPVEAKLEILEQEENLEYESFPPDEPIANDVDDDPLEDKKPIDSGEELSINSIQPEHSRLRKRKRKPTVPTKEKLQPSEPKPEIISISTGIKLGAKDLGCKRPTFVYKNHSQTGIKCCGCKTVLKTEDDLIPHSQIAHEPNKHINKRKKHQCSFCFQLLSIDDPTIKDHITVQYECEMCSLVYQNILSYDEHLQKYHQELVFRCCGCTFECDTKEQLQNHSEEVHFDRRKRFLGTSKQCDICYKKIPQHNRLFVHKSLPYRKALEGKKVAKSNIRKYLRCCGRRCFPLFDNEEQLAEHCKEVHLPNRILDAVAGKNEFECEKCYCRFSDRRGLRVHQRCLRKKLLQCRFCPLFKWSVEEVKKHEEMHKTGGFKCCGLQCKSTFLTYEELLEHGQKVHASSKKINTTRIKDKGGPLKCEICYTSYKNKHNLNRHRRTVYKDCLFRCDKCYLRTSSQASLDAHTELRHKEVENYPCKYCKKVFEKECLRTKHHKTHEMTEESFLCEICSSRFRRPDLLAAHALTHSSERKFKCKLCTLAFRKSANMVAHARRVHYKERKLPCRYCGTLFFGPSDRKKHERTHSALKTNICKYCGNVYKVLSDYYVHVETHVSDLEKKFLCNKCPEKFSEDVFLEMHILFNHHHMEVSTTANSSTERCVPQPETTKNQEPSFDEEEVEEYVYDEIGDPVASYIVIDGELVQEEIVT